MMRSTPYINKPPENWFTLLQALSERTLFLMSRNGPTVFKIRDEDDKMFKVTLGNPHTCTCEDYSRQKYCIHTIYCLTKVLRVDKQHPFAYQTSLTDTELDQVLHGQCAVGDGRRRINATRTQRAIRRPSNDAEDTSSNGNNNEITSTEKKLEKPNFLSSSEKVKRKELIEDEENICPICQDDLKEDQLLTWCRRGCGSNLHAQCMMKYHQHKTSINQNTHCPLCREDWDIPLLKYDCQMKNNHQNNSSSSSSAVVSLPDCELLHCYFCKCIIRNRFYRCLECSQKPSSIQSSADGNNQHHSLDYCNDCYQTNRVNARHSNHHFMLSDASVEKVKDVTWVPCKGPFATAITNNPLLSELQNRDITNNDYELLLSLDEHQHLGSISQMLISILPTITASKTQQILQRHRSQITAITSTNIDSATASLSPNQGSTKVCWCNNSIFNDLTINELLCGHMAHSRCIKEDIEVIVRQDISQLCNYRCSHEGCGKIIFRCLQRKKRKLKKKNTEIKQNIIHPVEQVQDALHYLHHSSSLLPISGGMRTNVVNQIPSLPALNVIVGTRVNQQGSIVEQRDSERRQSLQSITSDGDHLRPTRETIRQRVLMQRHRAEMISNDPTFFSSVLNVGVSRLTGSNDEVGLGSGSINEQETTEFTTSSQGMRPTNLPPAPKPAAKGNVLKAGKLRPMIGRNFHHSKPSTILEVDLAPTVTNLGIASTSDMMGSEILPTAIPPSGYEGNPSSSSSSIANNHIHTIRTLKRLDHKMQHLRQQRQDSLQQLEDRFDQHLQLSVTPLQSSRSEPSPSNLMSSVSNVGRGVNTNMKAVRRGSAIIHTRHVRNGNDHQNIGESLIDGASSSHLNSLMNINHYQS
eukprot:gene4732-5078_t